MRAGWRQPLRNSSREREPALIRMNWSVGWRSTVRPGSAASSRKWNSVSAALRTGSNEPKSGHTCSRRNIRVGATAWRIVFCRRASTRSSESLTALVRTPLTRLSAARAATESSMRCGWAQSSASWKVT